MRPQTGIASALDLLGPGDAPPEQDDLFDAPGALPVAPAARPGSKGGRPPGRRNKRTEEWVRLIQARYTSPLIGLAEIWSRPAAQLARELEMFARDEAGRVLRGDDGEPLLAQGAVAEAFKMQMAAKNAALPYLHQRLPQAIEVTPGERNVGIVVIGDLSGGGGAGGLSLPLADVEQNQGLTIDLEAKSEVKRSDDIANAMKSNGDFAHDD